MEPQQSLVYQQIQRKIDHDDFIFLDLVRLAYDLDLVSFVTLDVSANHGIKSAYNHLMIKAKKVYTTSVTNIDILPVPQDIFDIIGLAIRGSKLMSSDLFESWVLWSITGKRLVENQVPQIIEDYLHFTNLPVYFNYLFTFHKENLMTTVTFMKIFSSATNVDVVTVIDNYIDKTGLAIPTWDDMEQLIKKIKSSTINSNDVDFTVIQKFTPAIQNSILVLLLKSNDNKLISADTYKTLITRATTNKL